MTIRRKMTDKMTATCRKKGGKMTAKSRKKGREVLT
jgi:hypothetical protein